MASALWLTNSSASPVCSVHQQDIVSVHCQRLAPMPSPSRMRATSHVSSSAVTPAGATPAVSLRASAAAL
eukprot:11102918-Lingulodinium_polyedra.AAC.1